MSDEKQLSEQPDALADPEAVFGWEFGIKQGQLLPLNGWWFRVIGIVREKEPLGALVLEPTGERTGPQRSKR